MSKIAIPIPNSFEIYVDAAIVRASYLHPDLKYHKSQESMSVEISTLNETIELEKGRKDFLAILYRERIYSETLPVRKTIYGAQ